ncbi:hypothetical protein G7Z17_g10686 [Cylindrodendrum hubeiense]|uniref:Uncharacterized protein n=1 Tax=Cylindrodendrum hubeiense TaxID=595255 RepID=A0A9P5LC33_9HYPO|nr:hypothetical protein G7Z17_g10686 [Cylindrodendrum hubeiense]
MWVGVRGVQKWILAASASSHSNTPPSCERQATSTRPPLALHSQRSPPETQRTMSDAHPGMGKFGQAPFEHASATEATHVHPCRPVRAYPPYAPRPCLSPSDPQALLLCLATKPGPQSPDWPAALCDEMHQEAELLWGAAPLDYCSLAPG